MWSGIVSIAMIPMPRSSAISQMSFLKLVVYLTVYLVSFIFSGQQTTRQGHCSPLQTGLLQSFPLPAWQQPFLLISKGMPPSRSDWRTKMLNAVVRFMPSSVNSASACAFKSASMRILMFVVFLAIRSPPFLLAIIIYAICTKKTILCTNI